MFQKMVRSWFEIDVKNSDYNEFVRAMLLDDVDYMNEYMNEMAWNCFSCFDIAESASEKDHPERFYHGFVPGLVAGLSDRFQISSNRESGFGRYDIMLKPSDRERDMAYIIEFELLRIQPLEIASRWAGYLKPLLFHTVSAVNVQTCLNCYKWLSEFSEMDSNQG